MRNSKFFDSALSDAVEKIGRWEQYSTLYEKIERGEVDIDQLSFDDLIGLNAWMEERIVQLQEEIHAARKNVI